MKAFSTLVAATNQPTKPPASSATQQRAPRMTSSVGKGGKSLRRYLLRLKRLKGRREKPTAILLKPLFMESLPMLEPLTHGHHAETTNHATASHGYHSEGPPAHDLHAEGPLSLSHGHDTREQQTHDHRHTRDAGPPAQGRHHTEDHVVGQQHDLDHDHGHAEVKSEGHGYHVEIKAHHKREAGPPAQGGGHHTEDHVGGQQAHGHAEVKSEAHGYHVDIKAHHKREAGLPAYYLLLSMIEKEEIEKEVIFPRRKREIIAALLAELV